MSSDEQELRNQRALLLEAVNAKDMRAADRFLHPSFFAKGILGLEIPRGAMIALSQLVLMFCFGFREDIRIDDVDIEGDQAELTVTRLDRFRVLGVFTKQATDRYREIWQRVDARWLMRSEEHLGPGTWSMEGPTTG